MESTFLNSLFTTSTGNMAKDEQKEELYALLRSAGEEFPGYGYHPTDRKTWMSELDPAKVHVKEIVWPGSHDSATNGIGNFITGPFAECQKDSIYDQLVKGVRVLDIRVGENRHVYHGILENYHVDVVLDDVKRFLSETTSEIIILEIRTEYAKEDPPGFDEYLVERLGDDLIHQNNGVFDKTIAELLPRRVICVWKPDKSPAPKDGELLWNSGYLRDDWIDTDLPLDKFNHNLDDLSGLPDVSSRKYFYRIENTLTPQEPTFWEIITGAWDTVWNVNELIYPFARLFISQAFAKGFGNRLQIFSADLIEDDFVDACVGATHGRIEEGGWAEI